MEEYKAISSAVEKDLEKLKRKYSVQRHQLALLYKEHIEDNEKWQADKTNMLNENKKLHEKIETDSVKLQEYDVIKILITKNSHLS